MTERVKLTTIKDAMTWAAAEIAGETKYTRPEQREACLLRFEDALNLVEVEVEGHGA